MNTPGRSLYVRLQGPDYGPGAAGKWTDAATGEHGDLLDLIARNRDLHRLGDAMDEARCFLALPRPAANRSQAPPAPTGSPPAFAGAGSAARRLFHAGRSVPGTPAEAYLRARGITASLDYGSEFCPLRTLATSWITAVSLNGLRINPAYPWMRVRTAVSGIELMIMQGILRCGSLFRIA
jgi:hypothetical protein